MSELTCAQECQIVAKTLSEFTSAIPKQVLSLAMGIAVCNGSTGVALVRLPSQEWSAPCAILLQSTTSISPGQATVLLFMTEQCLYSLVGRTGMILGKTHSFMPGPMYSGSVNAEVLAYVRYNGGFTPEQLIRDHMTGTLINCNNYIIIMIYGCITIQILGSNTRLVRARRYG